jgi:hypothetical protein
MRTLLPVNGMGEAVAGTLYASADIALAMPPPVDTPTRSAMPASTRRFLTFLSIMRPLSQRTPERPIDRCQLRYVG